MAHPLSGADMGTLAAVVGRAGFPARPLAAAAILGAALGRAPLSLAERAIFDARLPKKEDLAPPVFILGHWRSGTTHLYNILCKSGDWAFTPPVATGIPWDIFIIGRAFRPLLEKALPEHRYIDNIPVTPDSPQEDEIAIANMSEMSFYHGIYFPQAFDEFLKRGVFFDGASAAEIEGWKRRFVYLMRKLSHLQGGKRLLIKNPVYTARLAMLREIFPGAKFINIRRNPYEVFVSMRNFYAKLFKEFALQDYAHVDIDKAILETFTRMADALDRDSKGLSAPEWIDIRYEELDAAPIETLRRIYDALQLEGFARAQPLFERYLASVKSFEKNRFSYSDEAAAKVAGALGRYVAEGGWKRPGAAA
jgi:hypothetical protein